MPWLLAVAGVLAAACVALVLTTPSTRNAEVAMDVGDFAPALTLTEVVPAGGFVYASVSRWAWEDLDDTERQRRVELLGDMARDRGAQAVYLVDEAGTNVAIWTRDDGARLTVPTG